MTARYTRPHRIDLGCSLENYALSLTLRDLADKAALGELEFLEVVAGCDGCDDRRACIIDSDEAIDLSTESLIKQEQAGRVHQTKEYR